MAEPVTRFLSRDGVIYETQFEAEVGDAHYDITQVFLKHGMINMAYMFDLGDIRKLKDAFKVLHIQKTKQLEET